MGHIVWRMKLDRIGLLFIIRLLFAKGFELGMSHQTREHKPHLPTPLLPWLSCPPPSVCWSPSNGWTGRPPGQEGGLGWLINPPPCPMANRADRTQVDRTEHMPCSMRAVGQAKERWLYPPFYDLNPHPSNPQWGSLCVKDLGEGLYRKHEHNPPNIPRILSYGSCL